MASILFGKTRAQKIAFLKKFSLACHLQDSLITRPNLARRVTFFSKRLLANVCKFGRTANVKYFGECNFGVTFFKVFLGGSWGAPLPPVLFSVCIYETVCLSINLSVFQSVFQSVCLLICLSINLSVSQSVCLSIGLSINLYVCQSVCLLICLSIYLSVCQSVCLSICLSVNLSFNINSLVCLFVFLNN